MRSQKSTAWSASTHRSIHLMIASVTLLAVARVVMSLVTEPTPPIAEAAQSQSPMPAAELAHQTFALIGDIRTSGRRPPSDFMQISAAVSAERPSFVLSVGDMINANDGADAFQQWDALKAAIDSIGARQFYPCLGNHDTNGSKRALEEYHSEFGLPANAPGALSGVAYSTDEGGVHLVCMSTEYPGEEHYLSDDQLNWLEQDLTESIAPYTLVFGHDPAFAIGPHVGGSLDKFPSQRDRFWQILQRHGVSAYLAGHEHLYNREVVDELTQVVLGTSGSEIQRGFGGEFVSYATFDLSPDGLRVTVIDLQGEVRDAFRLNARPGS